MPKLPPYNGNIHRKLVELHAWTKQGSEAALEPGLPIIDPHHHLWDDDHRGRYRAEEMMEDIGSGHNIVATVYVETGSKYRSDGPPDMAPVGEVEYVDQVANASAKSNGGKDLLCAGIVGHADLLLGDKARPVLEALIAAGKGRFRGIRYSTPWDTSNVASFYRRKVPRHELLDPDLRKGFAHLKPLNLSFDIWQYHPQMPDVADLLRAFPDTNVILNHVGGLLGIPPHDDRDAVFKIWRDHIHALAQSPNLTVKVGGFGMLHCGWDFHLKDVPPTSEQLAAAWRPYVEATIEEFGVKRCMLESNFPPDKQTCGYGVLWNALKRITQKYSAAEKAALYHDTAARVYCLNTGAVTKK